MLMSLKKLANLKNKKFKYSFLFSSLTPGRITVITGGCRPLEASSTLARGMYQYRTFYKG